MLRSSSRLSAVLHLLLSLSLSLFACPCCLLDGASRAPTYRLASRSGPYLRRRSGGASVASGFLFSSLCRNCRCSFLLVPHMHLKPSLEEGLIAPPPFEWGHGSDSLGKEVLEAFLTLSRDFSSLPCLCVRKLHRERRTPAARKGPATKEFFSTLPLFLARLLFAHHHSVFLFSPSSLCVCR